MAYSFKCIERSVLYNYQSFKLRFISVLTQECYEKEYASIDETTININDNNKMSFVKCDPDETCQI